MYYKEHVPEVDEYWIYDKFDIFVCTCNNEHTTDWLLGVLNKL